MEKIYLGTMDIPDHQMKTSIKAALDAGYYGIDCAWFYNNEALIGKVLAELSKDGYKAARIQTKIWPTFYDDPRAVLQQQLNALRAKKVDSLLLHRPSGDFFKTIHAWKELIKIKADGLADQIGVSNFDKDMIELLIKTTGVKPAVNQIELSVTNFRDDRYHYLTTTGIAVQAWSPMGKEPNLILDNEYVHSLARKYKVTPAVIAVSYLTSQGIVPVLKSTNRDHIFEMQTIVKLTRTEITELKGYNFYHNKSSETFSHRGVLKALKNE